jgi:hypothetical protein
MADERVQAIRGLDADRRIAGEDRAGTETPGRYPQENFSE